MPPTAPNKTYTEDEISKALDHFALEWDGNFTNADFADYLADVTDRTFTPRRAAALLNREPESYNEQVDEWIKESGQAAWDDLQKRRQKGRRRRRATRRRLDHDTIRKIWVEMATVGGSGSYKDPAGVGGAKGLEWAQENYSDDYAKDTLVRVWRMNYRPESPTDKLAKDFLNGWGPALDHSLALADEQPAVEQQLSFEVPARTKYTVPEIETIITEDLDEIEQDDLTDDLVETGHGRTETLDKVARERRRANLEGGGKRRNSGQRR